MRAAIVLMILAGCHLGGTDGALGKSRTGGFAKASDVPADPGVAPSPYDATLDMPRLSERASDLDLEALATRYTVYHVDVDLSALRALDRREAQQVELALAADPRWRVGVWDGAVVAFQRTRANLAWEVPRHGFHADDAGIWRTGVRFSPWDSKSEWAEEDLLTHAPADNRRLALRAFSLLAGPAAGLEVTALTVDGPAVAVDLFEATDDPKRPRTAEALSTVPMLIHRLADESIEQVVWDPGQRQASHLDVRSPARGMLEIMGRIDNDAPGWTWVRLLDDEGRAWEETAVAAGTRELAYGSRDGRRVWIQSQLPVPSGKGFSGTAEVWRSGVNGGKAHRIAAFPVDVPNR